MRVVFCSPLSQPLRLFSDVVDDMYDIGARTEPCLVVIWKDPADLSCGSSMVRQFELEGIKCQ